MKRLRSLQSTTAVSLFTSANEVAGTLDQEILNTTFPLDDEEQLRESVEKILYRRIDSTWLLLAFFNTLEHWLEDNQDVTFQKRDCSPSFKKLKSTAHSSASSSFLDR
jgi:hypothetical protein